MAFRDIIIGAYSKTPKLAYRNLTPPNTPEDWTQGEPIFVSVDMPTHDWSGGIPGSGDFYNGAAQTAQREGGGSFIRAMCARAVKSVGWNKGDTIGRIAVMGFSAGNGMLDWVLKNDPAASKLDFIYSIDGFYSHEIYMPFIRSAIVGGPMVVVTTSKVHDKNARYDSWVGVRNVLAELSGETLPKGLWNKSLGEDDTLVRFEDRNVESIFPYGLVGVANSPEPNESDSKGHYFKVQSGGNSSGKFYNASWPVESYEVNGNFVAVTFAGTTSSAESHVFQADWVQPMVFKELLIPRWSVECTKGAMEGASASPFVTRRVGTSLVKRDRRNAVVVSRKGSSFALSGEDETCTAYGRFATGILSPEEIAALERQATMQNVLLLGSALLVGGVIYWYVRD